MPLDTLPMYNLCCISLSLKEQGFRHRALRFNQFEKLERSAALEAVGERALANLSTTLETMRYAKDRGWGYRISSSLFPLFNLDKAKVGLADLPNQDLIEAKFREIHDLVGTLSPREFRISFHPDHFNVLCSENPEVVERTIGELGHHGWLMDRMAGIDSRNYWYPFNVHIGRSSGDPEQIAKEFIKNYERLEDSVKTRLVVENEDKGLWTPDKLHELIHKPTGIPITYDNLHHGCNPGKWSVQQAFQVCADSWLLHEVNPLFHYSEGVPGAKNPRAHAGFGTCTPKLWMNRHGLTNDCVDPYSIDFDIELKEKDFAIIRMKEAEEQLAGNTDQSPLC